jgi:glycerol-3-phosphate dehydrogenase (NAD(P)+)
MRTISVLGEGAFGSALAQLLATNGHHVLLWCHSPEIAQEIATHHTNRRYVPNHQVHTNIKPITELAQALVSDVIVVALPIKYIRSTLNAVKPFFKQKNQQWVLVCKGIEEQTHLLPVPLLFDILGQSVPVAYLAGPSFASEIVAQRLTAVTVAGSPTVCADIQSLFANDYFKVFVSDDLIGAQLSAACKNVVAIGMGIISQLSHDSDNTRAFFLSCALEEVARLVEQHGGKRSTVYSLAGVGDLVLSSLSSQGRNAQVGALLAQGKTLSQLEHHFGALPEGCNTLKSIPHLVSTQRAPLLTSLYQIVYEQKPASSLIKVLRQQK